jgi:hypothetical protein
MTVSYKHIIGLISIFLCSLSLNAQDHSERHNLIENVYSAGEKLNYNIRYGFIIGGKASLEIKNAKLNKKDVLHVRAIGRSAGILNAIYGIRDIYESFIDPDTDLPIKAIRNIKEGRYRRYNVAFFNRDSNTVFSTRKHKTVKVKPGAQDILSAFFYARKHLFKDNMQLNDTLVIETFFSEEPFTLSIIYKGLETIRTKFGKVRCYKFLPIVERGRVFREDDDLHIWITADKNKIPIKIRFDIVIGSLVCELDSFGGLSNTFEVIVK